MKKDNLLNQRFGRWTVIAPAESRNGRTYWLCRCDCGTEKELNASSLKRGLSKSCGCVSPGRRSDLTGRRFGRLTVLEYVFAPHTKETIWRCICDCGNETLVQATNLISGHVTSCGCKRQEVFADATKRVEGLKKSPNTGPFETNIRAKSYVIRDGSNVYKFRNLALFVRNNPHIFGYTSGDARRAKIIAKELSHAKSKNKTWHGMSIEEIDIDE